MATGVFDTTTIDAAVGGSTQMTKAWHDAIVTDLEKGIFAASGDTYAVLAWDASRPAWVWGQSTASHDLFLQRYSTSGIELKNAGNDEWRDLRVRHVGMATGSTPSTVATHGQMFVVDDTLKFMDTGGTVTELGQPPTVPNRTFSLWAASANLPDNNYAQMNRTMGTLYPYYTLAFDASTDESAFWQIFLPSDGVTTDVVIDLHWRATATSGNVVWSSSIGVIAAGDTIDIASWDDTASTTVAADGTANATSVDSITHSSLGSSPASGCLVVKLFRDADNGSDTMTGDAELMGAVVRFV